MKTYINNINDFRENDYCSSDRTELTDKMNNERVSSFQTEVFKIDRILNKSLNIDQRFSPFRKTLGLHKQSI